MVTVSDSMPSKPIALFYGSSTCYTEMAAEKIAKYLGEANVDVFNVSDEPIANALFYPNIIMGIPTWDYGELQEDWEEIWDEIDSVDFSGKTIALFGLGDQVGYPEWFLDALGYLHAKLSSLGANLVGYWPVEGYEFEESKALTPDGKHFVGLALDEENEFEQTDARIAQWCDALKPIFGIT
ncbi:flavodoxin FldB [Sessilibacter sp. MAH1]